MQKLKNIEFLRVIGCIAIVALHLFNNACLHGLFDDIILYDRFYRMTLNGQKAVDLFFIISGFFFAWKLNIGQSCVDFVKHKLIRLYPLLVFAILLSFISSCLGGEGFTFYDNILNLLLLNGTSLVTDLGNAGQFWYVSAMLWVMLFIFYLRKNYDKKHVDLILALLVIFSYSFIIHAKGGKINHNIQTFYNIFNIGMLRAIGGISVGYFLGEWYKENAVKINNWQVSVKQFFFISALEFMCLYFIINNLLFRWLKYKNHMIYIVAFTGIVLLFLIQKGFFSRILNNDFWTKLSKYTYSIYMVHIAIFMYLKETLWTDHSDFVYAHPVWNIFIALIPVIILGVLTYHFVEKPAAKYLSEKLNKN